MPDYRKITLQRSTFRGHPAVVWEYALTHNGLPRHGRQIGFQIGDPPATASTSALKQNPQQSGTPFAPDPTKSPAPVAPPMAIIGGWL
ncbi:hypothetical protein, partial [Actinacidiphila oryziradicis]|uniref:hypothetical protein n=1 Tax=Actinacidiphila oryziradicis TaxID=2571141 RepID=UPI0023EFB34A